MGATMVLGPSLRQAIVPAHLMGRVASISRMLAMCAAPFGAFLGGWPATTCDVRTRLYNAAGLLLTMTAFTPTLTGNRQVEAALRAAAPADGGRGAPPSILVALDSLRVPDRAQDLTGSAGLDVERIAAQEVDVPVLERGEAGHVLVLDVARPRRGAGRRRHPDSGCSTGRRR